MPDPRIKAEAKRARKLAMMMRQALRGSDWYINRAVARMLKEKSNGRNL